METITDEHAQEIAARIKACNRHFDPLREHENDYPEDDIANFSDEMLPYFVSMEERAQYAFYEWIHKPPKRAKGYINDEPFVEDDFSNVIGEVSITKERRTRDGTICTVRLHSYNRFDYHGSYNANTGEVTLIANRKFW